MWYSEKPAYGWIEYGKTTALGKTADMVIDGLKSANDTLHKIKMSGLEPGATYYYRACFNVITEFKPYSVSFEEPMYSETYTFQTEPEKSGPVSCVIFNDLHNNYAMFDSLCAVLPDTEYQFSIFNGDCFADPQSEMDVIRALKVYNDGVKAFSHPPIYIRGNHETRGAYGRKLKSNFDFPGDEFYFAMTAGPVRFIFLDCGEDKPDDHVEYSGLTDFTEYRKRQQKWLQKEISSDEFKNAAYRVLVHHIPLHNFDGSGISPFSRDLWAALLNDADIDIAINGHTHKYTYVPAGTDDNNYPVLIGGGSKNGTVMFLSASEDKLTIETRNTQGEILGKYGKKGNQDFEIIR